MRLGRCPGTLCLLRGRGDALERTFELFFLIRDAGLLSARVEYLYADYGGKPYFVDGVINNGVSMEDVHTQPVRGGLSWKFTNY